MQEGCADAQYFSFGVCVTPSHPWDFDGPSGMHRAATHVKVMQHNAFHVLTTESEGLAKISLTHSAIQRVQTLSEVALAAPQGSNV
jgi:hypothetical protein